jgi:hypothetical protein
MNSGTRAFSNMYRMWEEGIKDSTEKRNTGKSQYRNYEQKYINPGIQEQRNIGIQEHRHTAIQNTSTQE